MWNDFVQSSQQFFDWLRQDVVTGLLLLLSLVLALILVFLAWKFAADIRSGKDDEDQESEAHISNAEGQQTHIEITPVYTVSDEVAAENSSQVVVEQPIILQGVNEQTIAEEQIILQGSHEQTVTEQRIILQEGHAQPVEAATDNSQTEAAPLPQGSSATETLREGIALVMPREDETGEMGVRYDRSFSAKLIQSSDEVKEWYCEIKNYLLSFQRVSARTSWNRESFRIGKDCFARLAIKGKTLCIYLAIIPLSCRDTKYKIEDLADTQSCKDTPCLYRIKSKRRLTYAKELIDIILQEYDAILIKNREAVDYYMPYEGTLDLIKRGLIKRKIVAKSADFLSQVNSSDGDGMGVA